MDTWVSEIGNSKTTDEWRTRVGSRVRALTFFYLRCTMLFLPSPPPPLISNTQTHTHTHASSSRELCHHRRVQRIVCAPGPRYFLFCFLRWPTLPDASHYWNRNHRCAKYVVWGYIANTVGNKILVVENAAVGPSTVPLLNPATLATAAHPILGVLHTSVAHLLSTPRAVFPSVDRLSYKAVYRHTQ